MSRPVVLDIGRALEACLMDAAEAWKRGHAPAISSADLLANTLTSVTVEATVFAGGRMSVITTVRAKRQFDDETNVFRYVRVPQSGWRRMGSSLPST